MAYIAAVKSTTVSTTTPSWDAHQTLVALWVVAGGALLAGLIVAGGRVWLGGRRTDDRQAWLIRSWIAILLVFALVVFCAESLLIGDQQLEGTLFGGLIASVGTAIAFYFSSQNADQARQDIINAAGLGPITAPTAFDTVSPPPRARRTEVRVPLPRQRHPRSHLRDHRRCPSGRVGAHHPRSPTRRRADRGQDLPAGPRHEQRWAYRFRRAEHHHHLNVDVCRCAIHSHDPGRRQRTDRRSGCTRGVLQQVRRREPLAMRPAEREEERA